MTIQLDVRVPCQARQIQKSMQSGTNMIYLSFHDRMKYAFEDQDTLLASVEF